MADWRLRGQEAHMKGATLHFEHFLPMSEREEQTHCNFCWKRISELKEGYHTKDGRHWVCAECFADFRELLEWKVE